MEVVERPTESILRENLAADVPYRWTLNPYRGCTLGCLFCWGRGTHEYLRLDPATEFERKLWVKSNAATRLTEAFARPAWKGETVMFSPVTDPYQPLELRYGLTRACLEVCLAHRNPVMLNTKSALVLRDVDLLRALAREARLEIFVSIAFSDARLARDLEPGAPSPSERLEVVRQLVEAGLTVGVMVAPVIDGLNEGEVGAVLQSAASAGATQASWVFLRTPPPIDAVFTRRLSAVRPRQARAVLARSLGHRHGTAPSARARGLFASFRQQCGALGLEVVEFQKRREPPTTFRRVSRTGQLPLL